MKNRVIGGDDDQEVLQSLFDQDEEIQKLVDISNRQLMKKRFKEGEKKKAVIDTTTNAVKPEEFPEDLAEEAKPEKKRKKEKEPKKKKEKKTLNPNGVKNVIKIFILLILLLVVFQFRKEIVDTGRSLASKVMSLLPSQTEKVQESGDNTETNENSDVSGYLAKSKDEKYDLYDVLDVTTKANSALQNYYKNLVKIANDSKTTSVADAISTNADMIEKDKASLASYKDKFSQFDKGVEYYESLMFRFDELQSLIEEISWVDESKVYAYINKEITEENNRIIEGKNCFMTFLDANGVQYTVNDNNITYETN